MTSPALQLRTASGSFRNLGLFLSLTFQTSGPLVYDSGSALVITPGVAPFLLFPSTCAQFASGLLLHKEFTPFGVLRLEQLPERHVTTVSVTSCLLLNKEFTPYGILRLELIPYHHVTQSP
ncbi:hypothetical protein BDW22DRAFT_1423233 [Trametopsis cervina]|nr:hypothetical protein BDW22DRAFT_1423233 [Trametopsis cervina]